jgi:hypothetical protein
MKFAELLPLLAGVRIEVDPDCQDCAQAGDKGHDLIEECPSEGHDQLPRPSSQYAHENNTIIPTAPNSTLVAVACPLTVPPITAIKPTPLAMS